ncbi:hypothetical protein BV25DRAFT_1843821 [Artomyces pyxidatus]|uniref:Uncharacterized protein n=1 Tax=Artomyces pyxidatus TaxID=48021 RepID=A0ACB8SE01_9AGAM|nr:hypothetical protein BV25DRAFT_1843821 [Artomyces pyxidatus]
MRHVLKESQVVAKELIMSVLRETLMSLEVARLPTSPRRGTTTVTAKLWVSLGKSDCQPRRVMTKYLTQEEKQQVEVEQHITKLKDNDANAPWSARHANKLAKYLTRTVPPQELDLSNATVSDSPDDSFVTEVYHWVREHLDMQKPLHQLAVFSCLMVQYATPLISVETPNKPILGTRQRPFHLLFRALPWAVVGRSKIKGTIDGMPYPVMLSTLMIALYETGSPLRALYERAKVSTQSQDGDDKKRKEWSHKHTAKHVLPRLLARMGLLKAERMSIFTSGKMGQAWTFLTPEEIKDMHREMCRLLRSDWPAYMFFESLFGTQRARAVATNNGWPQPRVPDVRPEEEEDEDAAGGETRRPLKRRRLA